MILDDTALIRPHFSFSIMELADREGDRAAREKAGRALEAETGRMRSVGVRVVYEDDAALGMFRRVLGESSTIRLKKGSRNGIEAVELRGRRGSKDEDLLRRADALGIHLVIEQQLSGILRY